jgi:hypothetical protein
MVEASGGRNAAAQQGSIDMYRAILLLGLALPIAACNKPAVDEKNASVEEVSQKVREASKDEGFVQPGQWQSTVTIDKMDMPDMPPEVAAQMKKMVAQSHTSESCLTPAEAKQPKANFFSGNDNCRYDHFTMGNGKIDAKMHCEQGGGTQVMQMAGTYSPGSYKMHMTSTGGAAGHSMSMEMSVDAKRVGECTGKES